MKTVAMRNEMRPAAVLGARLRSHAGIAAGTGYQWTATKQVKFTVSDCPNHLTRWPMETPT